MSFKNTHTKKTKLKSMLVVGLMSGTSLDGIDSALVKITPLVDYYDSQENLPELKVELLCAKVFNFNPTLRQLLLKLIEEQECSLGTICKINFQLGEVFAQSVLDLIKQSGLSLNEIDLVASHGQTIYHIPSRKIEFGFPITSTLQIGESSIIAQRTGITTISDFRPRDISAGGQGAPLVCFADLLLFSNQNDNKLIQNIGGISNVSVLAKDIPMFGFDNGPGNSLMDLIAQKHFGVDYDKDGYLASQGNINENLVDHIIANEEYFSINPPKTTGKELFNYSFIEKYFTEEDFVNPYNVIANLTALTAKSISKSYFDFIFPKVNPNLVIIGGGGAYNKFLINLLDRYLKGKVLVKTHKDLGISDTFKEAIAFAMLGYTSFFGIPNNVPSCTGATENVVLGKITPGANFSKLYR